VDPLWTLLGVTVIVVGLVDVFLAVLHHDAVGFLTPTLYRWTWIGARVTTKPLPSRLAGTVRALAAPGMVVLTIAVWLGTQILGFALVYYPALGSGISVQPDVGSSLPAALAFSASALASLGFGDMSPRSVTYHALTAVETLVGLGIITLSISYILSLYQVLRDQNALAAALHHQAEEGGDPRSILAPHFVDGRPEGLSTHLREFHRSLVDQAEGMRRYPIVYFFKSRRAYRSIPYIFHMIGGVIAALRWGLPVGSPATKDPWLPSLLTGYRSVMREVQDHFVHGVEQAGPEPLPYDRFRAALTQEEAPSGDERLDEFFDLDRFMRCLAHHERATDPEEAYERYCEWLPFAVESAGLVSALAADLGIDIGRLTAEPEGAAF